MVAFSSSTNWFQIWLQMFTHDRLLRFFSAGGINLESTGKTNSVSGYTIWYEIQIEFSRKTSVCSSSFIPSCGPGREELLETLTVADRHQERRTGSVSVINKLSKINKLAQLDQIWDRMAFEWWKSAQPFSRNALDRQTDGHFSFEFPPKAHSPGSLSTSLPTPVGQERPWRALWWPPLWLLGNVTFFLSVTKTQHQAKRTLCYCFRSGLEYSIQINLERKHSVSAYSETKISNMASSQMTVKKITFSTKQFFSKINWNEKLGMHEACVFV